MVQFRQFIEFQLEDTAELLEFFLSASLSQQSMHKLQIRRLVSVKNNFNAEIQVPVLLKSSPGDVRVLSHSL